MRFLDVKTDYAFKRVFGSLTLAEAKGMESGIEKGREEIARNLLDILDDATIAAKTGLSAEQAKLLRRADNK